MRLVMLESPYEGDLVRNLSYAKACMRDSIIRGEAPFASHLLYTQEGILDDNDPLERAYGIAAGHLWAVQAEAMVVYHNYGISRGMQATISLARARNIPIELRKLENEFLTFLHLPFPEGP